MCGSYHYFVLDRAAREHAEINRRRLWNEALNREYIQLTGGPLVDDLPNHTTAMYERGETSQQAAVAISRQQPIGECNMASLLQSELNRIREIRMANPRVPARTLARQLYNGEYYGHASTNRPFYSTYSAIRRYDAKRNAT